MTEIDNNPRGFGKPHSPEHHGTGGGFQSLIKDAERVVEASDGFAPAQAPEANDGEDSKA